VLPVRILVVTPYLPHARVGHGGGTAVRSLIAELCRTHEVGVVSLRRPGEADRVADVERLGATVQPVPFLDRGARGAARGRLWGSRLMAMGRALATGHPFYVSKYASAALVEATIEAATRLDADVIQVEYLQLAHLLRDLRRWRDQAGGDRPRLILDSHELGSLPRRRRAAAASGPRRRWLLAAAASWDRLARAASGWADATLCVTDQDRELYAQLGGERLVTVPLGIDTRALPADRPQDPPPRALFLGSFAHPPNRSAARVLCQRIWPAVRRSLPSWRLVLAGPGSKRFLSDLGPAPDGVEAVGYVDDLDELFREAAVFVAPLIEGGGIKIKILEAMARGIPVVTTPIGAEGIARREDDLVVWAEDADAVAPAVVATAGDLPAAAARAARAREHVDRHFSWSAVVRRLEDVYRR
jgi:glycosyltransferase involved in cell wall biosynthesis